MYFSSKTRTSIGFVKKKVCNPNLVLNNSARGIDFLRSPNVLSRNEEANLQFEESTVFLLGFLIINSLD